MTPFTFMGINDNHVESFKIRSSSDKDKIYNVYHTANTEDWSCSCDDFSYRQKKQSGQCKHIIEIISTINELFNPGIVEFYVKSNVLHLKSGRLVVER